MPRTIRCIKRVDDRTACRDKRTSPIRTETRQHIVNTATLRTKAWHQEHLLRHSNAQGRRIRWLGCPYHGTEGAQSGGSYRRRAK
jgi:hypothetical protein